MTRDVPDDPAVHVALCGALDPGSIERILVRFGLTGVVRAPGATIPGSYWGPPEAGLAGDRLYFRTDTPVHSLLHELAHYVCMDPARRSSLDTDAGGSDEEECAVCYLEVLLAEYLEPFGSDRCLADMDAWGYSFRQGSASAWFSGDGREARDWLLARGLIDGNGTPSWRLRSVSAPSAAHDRGIAGSDSPRCAAELAFDTPVIRGRGR
jgi:hypothetical protein